MDWRALQVADDVEQAILEIRRPRNRELRPRLARPNQDCSLEEIGENAPDFVGTASGKNGDGWRVDRQPEPRAQILARTRRPREIHERVPHEVDRDTGIAVNLFLEREDDEHPIGDLADRFQATRPPRPDLRADVIHDRHSEILDLPGQW